MGADRPCVPSAVFSKRFPGMGVGTYLLALLHEPTAQHLHDFESAHIIVTQYGEGADAVIGELHIQIDAARCAIELAAEAGRPDVAARHRARLDDLQDSAARHGIDVGAAEVRARPTNSR